VSSYSPSLAKRVRSKLLWGSRTCRTKVLYYFLFYLEKQAEPCKVPKGKLRQSSVGAKYPSLLWRWWDWNCCRATEHAEQKHWNLFLFYLTKPPRITYGTKRQAWTDLIRGYWQFHLEPCGLIHQPMLLTNRRKPILGFTCCLPHSPTHVFYQHMKLTLGFTFLVA
jgi:hypothetical protein